jgi:(p)ppGpp synthase/HD superfamily hydrolase
MLNQFTSILANESCNIRSLEANTEHKNGEMGAVVDMAIEIRDKKQLDRVCSSIRRISGVQDVTRLR